MAIFHYVSGAFVPENKALISTLDLGVIRGYGVFDYIPVYRGVPFHLREHLQRLQSAAKQIELFMPMSLKEMHALAYALLEKNEPIDAGLRFIITGGTGSADQLMPSENSDLFLLFHPLTPHPEKYYIEGMRCVTANTLRLMPSIKTTNYLPAILAKKKATCAGFDDALYVNDRGEILEGTTCNVCFFKEGRLITSDSDEIVQGVTRQILLNLARNHFPIEFRSLPINEIESCQEAFLCSSLKDVIPLVQIDQKKVGEGIPGPQTAKLRTLYHSYIREYIANAEQYQKAAQY